MKKNKKMFKIRNKLVLFFLPFLLIPILVLSTYLTVMVGHSSIDQSIQIYQQSTDQLQQNILNQLSGYFSIGYDITHDSNVINYLEMYGEKDIDLYTYYTQHIGELITKAKYRVPDIQIHIYTSNLDLKFSGIFIRSADLFNQKREIVKDYLDSGCWEGVVESPIFENQKLITKYYLGFLMPIVNYKQSSETIGVLEILTDISGLKQYMTSSGKEDNIVLLTNSFGETIVSNTQTTDELLELTQTDSHNEEEHITYNGKDYLLITKNIQDDQIGISSWKLCNLIPLDYVYRNLHYIQRANAIICFLCIVVAIPFLILFSHSITKRIEYLAMRMKDISQEKYDVMITVPGNDEVAWLGKQFNLMLQKLNLLTKQAIEARLKQEQLENARKGAQILALQRQINPHYLFNTMESIRMSLIIKGDQQNAELIRIFAESFRVMIDGADQTISLKDEITFMHNYFTIQEFRYEGKISLHIHVSDKIQHYKIPKFLLQPIIENAIYHGLELKEGKGNIILSIHRDSLYLRIKVSDDGMGMEKKDLYQLRASLYSEQETGENFALRNIARRLRLIYGSNASITIQSEPNQGTTVRISIPIDKLEVLPNV